MDKRDAAANVIDLDAFRQRKMERARASEANASARDAAVFVPVWYCWVPIWTPAVL